MIGAIVGDIVGSVYEFDNIKTKDFPLFSETSTFTDDTVCTIAIDSDTLAAIAGAVAEARFGIPETLVHKAQSHLPREMLEIVEAFYRRAGKSFLTTLI